MKVRIPSALVGDRYGDPPLEGQGERLPRAPELKHVHCESSERLLVVSNVRTGVP